MAGTKDIYSKRAALNNKVELIINGKTFDVSDWIIDLAMIRDEVIKYVVPNVIDDCKDLVTNASNQLYDIVNDNWKDEYSN